MPNPIAIAVKGKGGWAVSHRARAIARRYGLRATKMDQALELLAKTLEPNGLKSTLPVTAAALARHSSVAKRYQDRGFEFAVHGLLHVDHTQLEYSDLLEQLHRARAIFERADIRAVGFRCPYLRWNSETLTALLESRFEYDSSQALALAVTNGIETEAYRRALLFYGAKKEADFPALPSMHGDLVRIPYCLPDDEALVERLELADEKAMADIWLAMLERTREKGELFTLGLHPERTSLCLSALKPILERATALSPEVWIARLDEIANWWRARAQVNFALNETVDGHYQMQLSQPRGAVLLARAIRLHSSSQAWENGYRMIAEPTFSFESEKLPTIGIAPDSLPELASFLRQHGFLFQVSSSPNAHSFFIHRESFSSGDERELLVQIESANWPLLKVARWPFGAKSALCVTGDIDAFTLIDYGLRVVGK